MTVKEFFENYQLGVIEDFAYKEAEKILARTKELHKNFDALEDKNSKAGLDILIETQYLIGKLEGMNTIMDAIEHLA